MSTAMALNDSGLLSEIDQLAVKSRDLVEQIRSSIDPEDVRSKHAQTKAVRKYMQELKQVHEIRRYLLPIEIACIVKATKLGARLNGVGKDMAAFFLEHGDDPAWYWDEFPGCETARHIWDRYRAPDPTDIARQHREYGRHQAGGFEEFHIPRDQGRDWINASNHDVSSAVSTLIEEYAWGGQSFSISDMAQQVLQAISVNSDADAHQFHMDGIKEVCRHAVLRERTETVGDRKAPRFVTCYDDVQIGEVEPHWVRIPFENARLSHLSQMIAIREEQLQQDIEALKNLKAIHEALAGLSSGPDDERTLGELSQMVDGESA
jgi:hypothetical protein